ncbi:MAG: ATP-binding protein [Erysipelotrichaceae bacterium]
MHKINFRIENSDQLRILKKEKAEHLLNHRAISALVANGTISPQEVFDEVFKFEDYAKNIDICKGCKGISFCKQQIKGNCLHVTNEDYLQFYLSGCRYFNQDQKDHAYLQNIIINHMPKGFERLSFSNIEIEKESPAYLTTMMKIRQWMDEPCLPGFYLCGDVGVGKSHLAACAINHFAKNNYQTGYIYVSMLVSQIKDKISNKESYHELIQTISQLDFVVFDDIGAESITPWLRDEILLPIFNARMENKKWTWFTSNDDLKTLYKRYCNCNSKSEDNIKAKRIIERIKVLSKEYQMTGINRRFE